uniref:Uncharacterized protein n=1 Tax=Rhizophora mucronata TaxID=61149 RepID=A0A2P2NTL3_RHIMU
MNKAKKTEQIPIAQNPHQHFNINRNERRNQTKKKEERKGLKEQRRA